MPRRNVNIAANKIVATQVFADTIINVTAANTKAAAFVLTNSDSGSYFFLDGNSIDHTLPPVADISAGWNAQFRISATWQGDVIAQTAVIQGAVIDLDVTGATLPAGIAAVNELRITGQAVSTAGDWFDIVFDGTNFLVNGQGSDVYLVFAAA